MSAKEMFIDIDMRITQNDDYILRYEDIYNSDFYVIFYKTKQLICPMTNYDGVLNVKELQAINKQIEELGWNNVKD